MIDYFSVARRLGLIVLLDFQLIGAFLFLLHSRLDWLNKVLPGRFGLSVDTEFTGNYFAATLFLVFTALLIVSASFFSLLSRLAHGALAVPQRLRHWLRDTGAMEAIEKEKNIERNRFRSLHRFFLTGAALVFAGFALSSYCYTRADSGGVPLFYGAQGPLPNQAVALQDTILFTVDQIMAGAAIGIPEQYALRVAPITFNSGNGLFRSLVMALRFLAFVLTWTTLFALPRYRTIKS